MDFNSIVMAEAEFNRQIANGCLLDWLLWLFFESTMDLQAPIMILAQLYDDTLAIRFLATAELRR